MAFAASIGSKGDHSWLSSHKPHTRRIWQEKESVIFWLLLSYKLPISNDITERRPSKVIVVVHVISFSFLKRISYNELRSCWSFEIIYKVYTRIAQRVEIVWYLTLSRRRSISYRNQYIHLQSKSMDWFLYDIGLHRERVNVEWSPISLKVLM